MGSCVKTHLFKIMEQINDIKITEQEQEEKKKKKRILLIILLILLLIALGVTLFFILRKNYAKPTIKLDVPSKVSISGDREFTIDIPLSDMPEGVLYPAASFSISFDKSRLEFMGIEEGNVFVLADNGFDLPNWGVNNERSNDIGLINIMYLDQTAGKYAFTSEGFSKEDRNILVRLKFKLRGSVIKGDVMNFVIEDAVLAASDSSQSLAMTKNTLNTVDGRTIADD